VSEGEFMHTTISPNILANAIIERALENKARLTYGKLQHLLFILFGMYYTRTGEKLFEEPFYVGEIAPFLDTVRYKFECFGIKKIDRYSTDALGEAYYPYGNYSGLTPFCSIFNEFWELYGSWMEYDLSTFVCFGDTPWKRAKDQDLTTIPLEYIREYFKKEEERGLALSRIGWKKL
jgi:uncharacterized phage-associated protein